MYEPSNYNSTTTTSSTTPSIVIPPLEALLDVNTWADKKIPIVEYVMNPAKYEQALVHHMATDAFKKPLQIASDLITQYARCHVFKDHKTVTSSPFYEYLMYAVTTHAEYLALLHADVLESPPPPPSRTMTPGAEPAKDVDSPPRSKKVTAQTLLDTLCAHYIGTDSEILSYISDKNSKIGYQIQMRLELVANGPSEPEMVYRAGRNLRFDQVDSFSQSIANAVFMLYNTAKHFPAIRGRSESSYLTFLHTLVFKRVIRDFGYWALKHGSCDSEDPAGPDLVLYQNDDPFFYTQFLKAL
jgi:hypothetical protein